MDTPVHHPALVVALQCLHRHTRLGKKPLKRLKPCMDRDHNQEGSMELAQANGSTEVLQALGSLDMHLVRVSMEALLSRGSLELPLAMSGITRRILPLVQTGTAR
jgi:hypothetical protein